MATCNVATKLFWSLWIVYLFSFSLAENQLRRPFNNRTVGFAHKNIQIKPGKSFNSSPKHRNVPHLKLKHCSFEALLRCWEQVIQYTYKPNGTGFLESDAEFEDFCFKYHDYTPYCVRKFFKRCSKPLHQDFVEKFLIQPYQDSFKEYCNVDGNMRKDHLRHSKCTIYEVKMSDEYRRTCIRDVQAGYEYLHERKYNSAKEFAIFWRGHYCVFNRWVACIRRAFRQKCGPDSEHIILDFVHQFTMRIISGFLPPGDFDPDGEQCKNILPTTFPTAPKGFGGKSFLSHAFSYLCPNVAYGLIPERDQ